MGERVLALAERHGWDATAFQTLQANYSWFFDGLDAHAAYVARTTADERGR